MPNKGCEFDGLVEKGTKIENEGTHFIDKSGNHRDFPMRLDPAVIQGQKIKISVAEAISSALPHTYYLYTLKVLTGPYGGLEYVRRIS